MMKRILFILTLLTCLTIQRVDAQEISLRTSATMWLTATPNIEVSFPLSKQWTVHLPVLYNPWIVGDGSRLQQLTTMPGIRWWKQQANVHYFASLYAVASRYHIGGWFGHDYRYDGTAYGPGIGAGYSYVLNRHWNIEAELGFGYLYTDYDKCGWRKNSHLYAHESGWKFLPTKFDVSFVYFF